MAKKTKKTVAETAPPTTLEQVVGVLDRLVDRLDRIEVKLAQLTPVKGEQLTLDGEEADAITGWHMNDNWSDFYDTLSTADRAYVLDWLRDVHTVWIGRQPKFSAMFVDPPNRNIGEGGDDHAVFSTNGQRIHLVQLFNDYVMTDQLPNGGNTMFMVDARNSSSESWLVFSTGN